MSQAVRILLITPEAKAIRAGNTATAQRWQGLLTELGFQVTLANAFDGQEADLMLAIHAWRSREAILAFRQAYRERPIIVLLAGTDLHHYLEVEAEATLRSLALADRLIGLHAQVAELIPMPYREKLRVVYQSAPEPLPRKARGDNRCEVCVVGHLRDEKDSLRAAKAVRKLPSGTRVHVSLYGRAETPEWQTAAVRENADNAHFHWHGEVSAHRVREAMASADAMVISSFSEGGANIVSEACRAGLPIIASQIPGNVGLLGDDYPAYFPAGDTRALAELLKRVESEPRWLAKLAEHVTALQARFLPRLEQSALAEVIRECL